MIKKFGLMLAVVAVAVLSVAGVYPPDAPTVAVTGTPTPGGTVLATVSGCEPGELVTFSLNGSAGVTVTCVAAADGGTASANVPVPNAAGTYSGTAVLGVSLQSLAFTVVVPAGAGDDLAFTGSSSSRTAAGAVGLVAIGGVLLLVGQSRRRSHSGA